MCSCCLFMKRLFRFMWSCRFSEPAKRHTYGLGSQASVTGTHIGNVALSMRVLRDAGASCSRGPRAPAATRAQWQDTVKMILLHVRTSLLGHHLVQLTRRLFAKDTEPWQGSAQASAVYFPPKTPACSKFSASSQQRASCHWPSTWTPRLGL